MRCLVLVAAACGHPAPVAEVPKAACVATLQDGHVAVDGKPTDLAIDADPDTRLQTWPHGNGLVVSWTTNSPDIAPAGSEDVYAIDCATHAVQQLFHADGADFGHAAADATTLYFTGTEGVGALDLAKRTTRAITHAPQSADCALPEAQAIDVVRSLHDDTLEIDRYPGCAFQPGSQTPYRLVHASKGGEARPVRPVGAVAVEAGGAVWAGNAACQPPLVWRSLDHAEHWLPIAMPEDGNSSGPTAIIADRAHVGQLVFEMSYCVEPPTVLGGRLYTTRDAGKSWSPIVLPEDIQQIDDQVGSRLAVASRDGSIAELVITGDSSDGSGELASWLSTDGGQTWLRMPRPKDAVKAAVDAHDGAWLYRPSSDGLVRIHAGKTETFYPQ